MANQLRRLGDELQLKMHLARMDARDRWHDLRPRLVELETTIEKGGRRAGHTLADSIAFLKIMLRELRDEVVDQLDPERPR
jgi:hypothetical protein